VEKYCRAGQDTDDNMAETHCMLDIWGYKYNSDYVILIDFITARTVAVTRLNVTLYAHCLSCFV
jgi:hypothetical protein